ncbi:MAG TPA: dihydrofolate reductase family protein [Promineifilum sp.]|nr:dihydrofolate reductase family protein [Promineifilum sp.]
MRKVIFALSQSLDGFIESTEGSLDWGIVDEEIHRHFNDLEDSVDIQIYGRRLYETMAAYWPTADKDPTAPDYIVEYARIWQSKERIVFSNTITQVDGSSRLFSGDITTEIKKLKEQPGKDIIVGGPTLAATFMRLGLIDEYRVYIHPVILGGGKPMFGPLDNRIGLRLVETHTFNSGIVLLRYQAEATVQDG